MMEPGWHQLVNGTSLRLGTAGILLIGPTGSGKSDLALRLIDRGAQLIADDLTELRYAGSTPAAHNAEAGIVALYPQAAPPELQGRMEVRGLGIMPVPHVAGPRALTLVVELTPADRIERLPEPATRLYGGIAIPCIQLDAYQASSTAKLRLAVAAAGGHIMAPL